jgi:hypothetical protein
MKDTSAGRAAVSIIEQDFGRCVPPKAFRGQMQVTEVKTEGLEREFRVAVPAAEIEQRITTRLQELARTIRMPGFRPGKAP